MTPISESPALATPGLRNALNFPERSNTSPKPNPQAVAATVEHGAVLEPIRHGLFLPPRGTLSERGDDLYETPPLAVQALLRHVRLPHVVWDPCCGPGNITNVLRAAGHQVVASDLVNYGPPITPPGYYGVDFLLEHRLPIGVEGIVANPPFKLAEEFVAHAMNLRPHVAVMLFRLAFLEGGTGKTKKAALRRRVLDEIPPARVLVFKKRLEMVHRSNWTGPNASSAIASAWFIWDRKRGGPTTIERISWEESS